MLLRFRCLKSLVRGNIPRIGILLWGLSADWQTLECRLRVCSWSLQTVPALAHALTEMLLHEGLARAQSHKTELMQGLLQRWHFLPFVSEFFEILVWSINLQPGWANLHFLSLPLTLLLALLTALVCFPGAAISHVPQSPCSPPGCDACHCHKFSVYLKPCCSSFAPCIPFQTKSTRLFIIFNK